MSSESTTVKTIYDCALINFVETKNRVRRQVNGNSMAGVIFGPNRPSTRFRFSDVPSTKVITTRQGLGTNPVRVHHIVMASGTNQTSETRSESGKEASVKLLTISPTGNVATSQRRSMTSESIENQEASGIRSNKVLVRKGQPTVGRTVVLNLNQEASPINTNVLISSRNENLAKTDDSSLKLAPTNANVMMSSAREDLTKLDDATIKLAPTNVNVLTISRKENQAKINDASLGINVPSDSSGDSNVLVTATGMNQEEYNSVDGVLPSGESRLTAIIPSSDRAIINTSSRSVSALTPATNTKLNVVSGNTQQSNRNLILRLPEMRESVVDSRLEITANQPSVSINTIPRNLVNSNSVVTAGGNNVGIVDSVRTESKQVPSADNSISGAKLGRQTNVRTVASTVRLNSPKVSTNMLISRRGNLENSNIITDTARLGTPAIKSDMLTESRSVKQNVLNVNSVSDNGAPSVGSTLDITVNQPNKAVSGIDLQQSPLSGTTIDITINRPSMNSYLETPNTVSSNFVATSPGDTTGTSNIYIIRGNQELSNNNSVLGAESERGNLVNTRTGVRNVRVQLPSVDSNLLLSGRQNLANPNIITKTVRQETPAVKSDMLTVSRSTKQNVANMNSVSGNNLQRAPSTFDITVSRPNMDIDSDAQRSIVASSANTINRADAKLVEGYQEQPVDSSVLKTTIDGGRHSNAETEVRTVRLQSPSVSSNLLVAANLPNTVSSNSIITSQTNTGDTNPILVDTNQAKPASIPVFGGKQEDPKKNTKTLLRTVRVKTPSVSSDISVASERNVNVNIFTNKVRQEPPAIRSNMFMTSRGGIKEVTGDNIREPTLVQSNTAVAIKRGDINKLSTINKHPSLFSEHSKAVRVANNGMQPVDRARSPFNLNVLAEYAQDNADNSVVVNALKKGNAHSVSSGVLTVSQERNQADLIGNVTSTTDEKARALSSNIITNASRPHNKTELIFDKVSIPKATSLTITSADVAGTANFSELSNLPDVMTTSIPLEWGENGTYFDNGTYYTNYTEYGNYSYYSNETLYPDYASMYENETMYGNYSYNQNKTFYSDKSTVFENETGYSLNMTDANVTVIQRTKVNATDISTIDISIVPIRNETLVSNEILGNNETRTNFPAADSVTPEVLVPMEVGLNFSSGYDSESTLTNADLDNITVSGISRLNESLSDSVTKASEEPVLTDVVSSDVASTSVDNMLKPDTPTTRFDAYVTPATDPTVPTIITSISRTATDKYSNINFESIRPGRVSYLPDYKNYIDDHGGVPIMIEGNERETSGTESVDKTIETSLETTMQAKNVDINTIDESSINSNEKSILTNVNTENKVMVDTAPRAVVDDSIVRTPKVVIAYPVDTIDSNSVAVGQWDNEASAITSSSVELKRAGLDGSITVGDMESNSLIRDIIRELNIVSRGISEEKLRDDNARLLDLTSVKFSDTSPLTVSSSKTNVNMPPISISYPRDSLSVAIGMGVRKELEDKNMGIVGTPIKLENDLTGVTGTSDETPGPNLKDQMDAEILQTGGIVPPPIIVPSNVLLTNEAGMRSADMERNVFSMKPGQNIVRSLEKETNMLSEEITPVTMPPIFLPTSRPRTVNSYPGYELINMVNNNKGIKTSYDFFNANNIETPKQSQNIPKTDISINNGMPVGLSNILYPIETIKPEYTITTKAKSGSVVKTIWKGPGITVGAAPLHNNARRTATNPISLISFKRLRPPSIRPKDTIQTLDKRNMLNLDQRAAKLNNMRLINSISSAVKTSEMNSNAIVDNSGSASEANAIPPKITPEYIASINSNIQFINEKLMKSIELNGDINSAPVAGIRRTEGQKLSIVAENPGSEISMSGQNLSAKITNITGLSNNKKASEIESTSVSSSKMNISDAKLLPIEEISNLNPKTAVTRKETTSELKNKSQLLSYEETKPSMPILNSTQDQSNLLIIDSGKSRVTGLNSAQFDDISLQILQTLQKIVQELQLNRDLVLNRHGLLQSQSASTNEEANKDSLTTNSVVSKNEIRGNSFDLAQDVPGIERKIGNVNTLATNLDLVNERLTRQGIRDKTNALLQVHPNMLSIVPESSQRGVATNAQARRQDWLRTSNLISMADVRPWLSNQEDNTAIGGSQGLTTETGSKIDAGKNLTPNDTISQAMSISTGNITDITSTNLFSKDLKAVAESVLGFESRRSLSEFSNTMPLVRMGIVRKGIPIALDTASFPTVSDTLARQTNIVGDQLTNSLLNKTFQSNINTVSSQPQLDTYSTAENIKQNETSVSELKVKNMSPQRSAQTDTQKNLLLATLNDFYNNNQASNVYVPEPSRSHNNNNDQQGQVYDFSGLTEAQKTQITRGLSNAFTEYAVPNTEPHAKPTSGIDVPVYICPNGERFSCSAVGVYDGIPGMEWWCFNHCRNGPCPKAKCQCTCYSKSDERAFNIGSLIMGSKKDSQQIQTPIENSKVKSNASENNVLKEERKKMFKKVITLTLNGSKEKDVQINDKGPEFMVSLAPKIISNSEETNVSATDIEPHPTGDSVLGTEGKSGSVTDTPRSWGHLNKIVASGTTPKPRKDTFTVGERSQQNGKSRLMIIDNRLVCRGIGKFEHIIGIVDWCTTMCRQAICPEFVCTCWS